MLTERGRVLDVVKVLDFGLAKELDATSTDLGTSNVNTVLGTPHYMAPELLQGKPADARSDLWALGVVLHEMLSGGLPFQGSTVFEVSSAILSQAPPPLPAGVPSGLRTTVKRILEKQPEDRHQNAGELRAALETPQMPAATSTSKRWLWPVGAIAVLALAGGWLWQQQPAQQPPARQQPQTAAPKLSTGAMPSGVREANEDLRRVARRGKAR